MKFTVRDYQEDDIEFLQENDFLHSMEIQSREDCDSDMIFTILDEAQEICAIGDLSYHKTWFDKRPGAPRFLKLYICVAIQDSELYQIAIDYAWMLLERKMEVHRGNPCGLVTTCRMGNLEEMQKYLEAGFAFGETEPVLRYQIQNPGKANLPAPYRIEELQKKRSEIERYIAATAKAKEGVPDSMEEYLFHSNDDSFVSYYVTDGRNILAGINVCDMDENGVTHNLFVLPEYRRKSFGDALLKKALEYMQERGYDLAMTSLSGLDEEGMQLYLSFGYELDSFFIQMTKMTVA